jgi:glycosyltransferase involved in cell wall biosynthesis
VTRPLKVAVDARLVDGLSGGVQQIVLGLAYGLSRLEDGEESYLFLTFRDASEWLKPHLKGGCRELAGPPARSAKDKLRALAPAFLLRGWDQSRLKAWLKAPGLEDSDGTAEAAGAELLHFPFQSAFRSRLPSIYMPQDLQHCHFPEYFSPWALKLRDFQYRAYCDEAALVAVMSRFGKEDLQRQFGTPSGRIAVIGGGSVLAAYDPPAGERIAAFRSEYGLPEAFIVYSAQTFPHKNHLGLLRAMALLRDGEKLKIPVVFCGRKNEFYPVIDREIKRLGLRELCHFTGYLGPEGIQCAYALAKAMIIPSFFEGWGMPLTEAMHCGLPVAVADNSMLTEQAGEAALPFDPANVSGIALALKRLWTDEALRRELARKGKERALQFGWEKAARVFRAQYRRLAGRELGEEDRHLVAKSFGSEPLA